MLDMNKLLNKIIYHYVNSQRVITIFNFLTYYIFPRVLTSMFIGLRLRFMTLSESSLSLYFNMTSKTFSFIRLFAALMLLTPCKNYVIFSNPVVVSLLLHIFSPLILCILLARCTYSTNLSLGRLHYDKSKKSDKVFLVN